MSIPRIDPDLLWIVPAAIGGIGWTMMGSRYASMELAVGSLCALGLAGAVAGVFMLREAFGDCQSAGGR